MNREPGIYYDVPEEEYHAGPEVSQSALKMLDEPGGAAKLHYGLKAETQSQRFGTLIHGLILRPEEAAKKYVPTRARRGSKEWEATERVALGQTVISQAEFDEARYIRDSIERWSPLAKELLSPRLELQTEVSFYSRDEPTGLMCRGRVDMVCTDYQVLGDIKSTVSAAPEDFSRDVLKWGYQIQDAFYRDGWAKEAGWEPTTFVFIVVEKTRPYLAATYDLNPSRLEDGREKYRRLLDSYAEYKRRNWWPGYMQSLVTL